MRRIILLSSCFLLGFIRLISGDDNTMPTFKECFDASNATLVTANPELGRAGKDLLDTEKDNGFSNYLMCVADFAVFESKSRVVTCIYDWTTNPYFDSYKSECETAGGVLYVWTQRYKCSKTGSRMNEGDLNSPLCLLPSESSCNMDDIRNEIKIYALDQKENEISCEVRQNDFVEMPTTLDSGANAMGYLLTFTAMLLGTLHHLLLL